MSVCLFVLLSMAKTRSKPRPSRHMPKKKDEKEKLKLQRKRKVRKQYTISQAESALFEIQQGMSVKKAAAKWSVPRTTLMDFKKGKYAVDGKPGPNPVLSKEEENLLCEWILELARRGIPINRSSLLDSVQTILNDEPDRNTPFTNNRPGTAWFQAFINRHPGIAQRHAESISRSRGAVTEQSIRGWFSDLSKLLKERNIEYVLSNPKRQFNADETGFQLDPHAGRVLAPKGEVVYTESGGLREQITVLVTSRADGKLMTSAIVYPYKRAVPKTILEGIPDGFCAARSDKGWMDSQVFFEYMANTFIPELARVRREEKGVSDNAELMLDDNDWVIFWIDGYSSHLTLHTSKICDMNKIMLYCFKAHASHICQPNDLGPFKPLKAEWRTAVTEWRLQHPYEVLSRINFAGMLAKAVRKLNPEAISAGYKAAGLYPFDPEAVHYERLTSMNQREFDQRAFSPNSVTETENQITLRCIENALGSQTVAAYKRVHSAQGSLSVPEITAYSLWKYFHESVNSHTDGEVASGISENDQACVGMLSLIALRNTKFYSQ